MPLGLPTEPQRDCARCPRLAAFRATWRAAEPTWFNAPVPIFEPQDRDRPARLLVVGLAPGLRGANRTGRPFTGDYAGDLLYATLNTFGFATGTYEARPDDGLTLIETRIINAVRCVPPENKPNTAEIRSCRDFLRPAVRDAPGLKAVVTLGKIAHDSTVAALGARPAHHPFGHGARSRIGHLEVFSSYHCSRYNTNTRVLTPDMFHAVFRAVRDYLEE